MRKSIQMENSGGMTQWGRIICALESGATRTHEIACRANIPRRTVWARLAELQKMGVVRSHAARGLAGSRGSPKCYELTSAEG